MRAATTGQLLAALSLWASAAVAEPEAMAPDAFLALAEGNTVHYERDGEYYGSERFYGKGRATWQFPGANCEDGLYWVAEDEICFRYSTASCWSVVQDGENRAAVSRDGFAVTIDRIDDAPLRCDGEPMS